MAWFIFDGSEIEAIPDPLEGKDDDWVTALESIGYHRSATLSPEGAWIWGDIWAGRDAHWMVSLTIGSDCMCEVVCPTTPLLMKYLGIHILPLLQISQCAMLEETISRADEILFDPDAGLQCAQRWGDRRRREAYQAKLWREEQQRKKAEKAQT